LWIIQITYKMIDTTDKRIPAIAHDPNWESLRDSTAAASRSPPDSPAKAGISAMFRRSTSLNTANSGPPLSSAEEIAKLKRRYGSFNGGPTALSEIHKQQALLAWDGKGHARDGLTYSTRNDMNRF
jgi:hypothetical protein